MDGRDKDRGLGGGIGPLSVTGRLWSVF
jgi:hypothetical protein